MPLMKTNLCLDLLWGSCLGLLLLFLLNPAGLKLFLSATKAHPVLMGYAKYFVLASMGELLAIRITRKTWVFKGIHLLKKAIVWGFLGILVTYAFPLFSGGVNSLVEAGMLPVFKEGLARTVLLAFYKSVFLNIVFGFQFMVLHRFSDSLIYRPGPFLDAFKGIDWDNMWKVVGFSLLWFWIPAQTVTFSFPPEFRILIAALLSICLGVILALAKSKSRQAS
jgi:hypothetical protein